MISKSIVFAALICAVVALNLNFEEDGGKYTEKILINEKENTVEYDVPKHGRVGAAKYLKDYASGYNVIKEIQGQKCYVMDLPKDEPTPTQVRFSLEKVNGTFPDNKYYVKTNNILPLYTMDRSQLSASILTFCGNYPIIKVIVAKSVKDIEKAALQRLHVHRTKRSATAAPKLVEYPACDKTKVTGVFLECGNTPEKMILKCRQRSFRSCIYKVTCTPIKGGNGWQCPGDHVFTIRYCCDAECI